MAGIIPIPTTRISGLLTRQRLTQQYQADQLELFRLQEQISTGYRISVPSEDAPAAIRAISLQRLINRKDQLDTNITIGLQFLASTDDAVNDVATLLSEIKASTLSVISTIDTQEQRDAAIQQINRAIENLVKEGNRKVQGRYIFGGEHASEPPYSIDDNGNVVYHGDDGSIQSYSDLGVLFRTNASGQEVFGGISEAVQGSVDLNPQLSADTLLSSLHGGRGINPNGSLQIANLDAVPNEISIVDISNASTVGDVVRLIEDNPPAGSTVNVAITGSGLQITLDGGTSNLNISEVGTGTAARELGLLTDDGADGTVDGDDLDPQLLKTTQLDDLLGTKARASLTFANSNNDILIEAGANGAALDGVEVSIANSPPLGVTFTPGAPPTLVINVDEGTTTAQEVVDAINADGTFTAALDLVDSSSVAEAGTGVVAATAAPILTTGGSGQTLNQTDGIRVVNGGQTYDIDFAGAETVEDLLNVLNASEAGLLAEINAAGDGINVRSRLSGNDLQIGENGGNTASQLGIRTYDGSTRLSDFNYGVGVPTRTALETAISRDTLDITTSDGAPSFNVDLSAATSLGDVIIAINAASAGSVTAQLDPDDPNALQLIDNTEGTGTLDIQQSGAAIGINGGVDVSVPRGDFAITASTGDTFTVDLTGASTVQDVIDLINNDTGNDDGGGTPVITARLAQAGNGIELVDVNGGSLTVASVQGSEAAEFLGFVEKDQTSNTSATDVLTGADRHFLETDSIFTTLIRLRDALEANDVEAVGQAAAKIDEGITRVTFAQADVGARFQGLQLTQRNLEDEVIQLRSALSEEIDVDLVQAISDLTARQISLEASLRATSNILQLSLLNFI